MLLSKLPAPAPNILAKPGRVLAYRGSGQRDPSKLASSTTDGGDEDPFQIRFPHAILAGRWELQPQHPRLPSLDDAKERVSSSARRLPHYQLFPKPLPKSQEPSNIVLLIGKESLISYMPTRKKTNSGLLRLGRMTESAWLKRVKRLLGLSVASNFTGVSLLRNLRPLKHEIHAKMGNNQHDALVERSRN
uniref:Uncharacterized protein n=1 Tax=Aegilops tauschii subsp. strangulata TaxID=200361 RepID=A0A452Z463_AEGTS